MDIRFTEEQEMIRQSARNFLAKNCPSSLVREMVQDERGYTEALWRGMVELGWMGLVFPEEYGGSAGSFLDLLVLLEEMGRVCLPGPFFSTVVLGGLCLLEAGNHQQQKEILSKISSGEIKVTLALTEAESDYHPGSLQVSATRDRDDYRLNGTKLFVPDAQVADYILCAARTGKESDPGGGITLFIVAGKDPGIQLTALQTIAGDKQYEVKFQNVRVSRESILGQLHQGWPPLRKVLQKAAVAKAAEMVGAGDQILSVTVAYAKERVQFGRAIGSFQSIQHHCSNMLVDVEACRWVTYKTAWMIDQGLAYDQQASVAKAWCNEAYRRIVALGHQVLGGVGYCEEHDLPLYFRRDRIAEVSFGDSDFHRRVVAEYLFA
jgi:3-oxocholest-4-en-26-oyl-CoA dehydrogenase beta subunit